MKQAFLIKYAEIGIKGNQAVFALIGGIQEETHNTAISYQRKLREESYGSVLEKIPGVGPGRRATLMKAFQSLRAIRGASVEQLREVVPQNTARAVYAFFHGEEGTACASSPEQPAEED